MAQLVKKMNRLFGKELLKVLFNEELKKVRLEHLIKKHS